MKITKKKIERYSRQLILKKIGITGKKKLLSANVLIVGAGGLGSPIAIYLAALGIEEGTVGWAGARQEITEIAEAPEREAGEIVVDEGDAHERIMAFLDELKVL